jgi:succinyl-diaminopimelate desuccinylase
MSVRDLLKIIEDMRHELVDLTREFIQVPTVNPPGERYEEMADLMARKLNELGFSTQLVKVPDKKLRELGLELPRVNLVGVLKGLSSERVLCYNGHYDVVPPGSGWSVNPFSGVVMNGRIYGRGASDMKGANAAMIIAVKALREAGFKLGGDLVYVATPDEETGGHAGAEYVVREGLVRGDACIIGEPTEVDKIAVAHKGALWLELIVYGKAAHGSLPHKGINAVEKMAKVIVSFEKLKAELTKRKTKAPMPEESRTPTMMIGGVIQGGVKINVVPDKCVVTIDRRLIPEENVEHVLSEIQEFVNELKREDPELRAEIKVLERASPAYTREDEEIVKTVKSAIKEVLGRDAIISGLTGFTDMRFFNEVMPTILYGPGSMSQAHVADEHISIDDLVTGAKVYALTILKFLGYKE